MRYYFFYLEMAVKDEKDLNIYASINLSHIPTNKLVEIFKIDVKKDPQIIDGYFLTKSLFRKNKAYISKEIGHVDLNKFEYCLRQYVSDKKDEVRKMYKLDLME
jgi:hypothetical protein